MTTAIRIPAKIVGSASGRSTRNNFRVARVTRCPIAASCTSGGNAVEPGTMFRIEDQQLYVASGMIAVRRDSPVYGNNNANAASDGIVYSTPVVASTIAVHAAVRHRRAARAGTR